MSETSILYLIRHASFILTVGLHMPTSEHCWKNSGAQWARTSNLRITAKTDSQLSYIGRYVELDNFYCTVLYCIATMLHLTT